MTRNPRLAQGFYVPTADGVASSVQLDAQVSLEAGAQATEQVLTLTDGTIVRAGMPTGPARAITQLLNRD